MKLFNVTIRVNREKYTVHHKRVTLRVEGKAENKRVFVVSRMLAL